MCTKTPKPAPVTEVKPQYLRNPLLDGLTIGAGQTQGRTSLRIDPGAKQRPVMTAPPLAPLPTPGLIIPTSPTPNVRSVGGKIGLAH